MGYDPECFEVHIQNLKVLETVIKNVNFVVAFRIKMF